MTHIRRTALVAAVAGLVTVPVIAANAFAVTPSMPTAVRTTSVASTMALTLSRPTGPYAVGQSILEMVDRSRRDPWVPSAGPRRLMVSMFYPARRGSGVPAPYMTTAEAQLFLAAQAPGTTFPARTLADTRTYAHGGARPEAGRFPLVVLSPGFTMPRAALTGLAVDLSSRGYVVALVNHTYEDSGTTFPDGQTLSCAICGDSTPDPALIARSRARDVSFVIDQLTGSGRVWRYAHLIDRHRIGVAGHSLGGDAAMATMAEDKRVRAGADLDGAFFAQVPENGLDGRPFLLLGNPTDHSLHGGETSWSTAWQYLDGWKRWLTITGTNHVSFTDVPVLADEAGIPGADGTISSLRAQDLTRTYVAAFFDLQLKGRPQHLLDGPARANPEVVFQQAAD